MPFVQVVACNPLGRNELSLSYMAIKHWNNLSEKILGACFSMLHSCELSTDQQNYPVATKNLEK